MKGAGIEFKNTIHKFHKFYLPMLNFLWKYIIIMKFGKGINNKKNLPPHFLNKAHIIIHSTVVEYQVLKIMNNEES